MIVPEVQLAKSVIALAIEDSLEKRKRVRKNGEPYKCTCQQSSEETATKSQARSFLCSESGSWAQSREFWCDMAGFPSEWLLKWGKDMEKKGWIPDDKVNDIRKAFSENGKNNVL